MAQSAAIAGKEGEETGVSRRTDCVDCLIRGRDQEDDGSALIIMSISRRQLRHREWIREQRDVRRCAKLCEVVRAEVQDNEPFLYR